MILTTTGCYGTGSSAVTDLLREFDGISCVSDQEIRILHDPDGVSDLEYNLIENPNRHNTSHSIKRFKRRMYELDHVWFVKRFSRYFGKGFPELIDSYIDSITEMKYHGIWHYDEYDRGKLFYIASRSYSKLCLLAGKIFHITPNTCGLLSKKEPAYLGITNEKEFLDATKRFINELCVLTFGDNKDYVVFDQLIPPSNFKRYLRYVDDLRGVLVERDPRDLFLLEKVVWKGKVAPTEDVVQYCKWYKWTRELYEKESFPEEILFIRFEDLVYDYERTKDRIVEHFKISRLSHARKCKFFTPEVSAANTQLWKKIKGYEKEIEYIKNSLSKYCYNFEEKDNIEIKRNQKMF